MRIWLSVTAVELVGALSVAARRAGVGLVARQGWISGARVRAAGFQAATGQKVNATQERDPMATINAGQGDIAIANPPVIDKLIGEGKMTGSRVDWGRA